MSYPFQPLPVSNQPEPAPLRPKRNLIIPVLLFAATVISTLAVGARLAGNFLRNLPAYDLERDFNPLRYIPSSAFMLLDGLPFALTLLTILLAHELGHFFACERYRIAATYPFFLPAPTIIGTMGAFIRIKSQIPSRAALFDVAIAGPLAGFVIALPFLLWGIAHSRPLPGLSEADTLHFGNPLLILFLDAIFHPGVLPADINLHPVARAAWVGLFATALNLLPAGQLDGGHLLYAWDRGWHALSSRFVALLLGVPMAVLAFSWLLAMRMPAFDLVAIQIENWYWPGWFLWGALLAILGTRHPPVWDPRPLDATRRRLLPVALLILILSFVPVPFQA